MVAGASWAEVCITDISFLLDEGLILLENYYTGPIIHLYFVANSVMQSDKNPAYVVMTSSFTTTTIIQVILTWLKMEVDRF